jgi:cyanate permease
MPRPETIEARETVGASVSRPARSAGRVFHGWWIVLTAFVCHAVNVGLMFYAWSVFLTPLAAEFGSRARIAGAYSLTQFACAAYGLLIGRIVDQQGARRVEIVGAFALAAGFAGLSFVDWLPLFYLCMAGPVAFGSVCIGALPNNAAVARWFVAHRGRALGIATAGISAGGIVLAPLAQYLIEQGGWRFAYRVLALLVLVAVLPPVLAFMRRDPADLGLLPDGRAVPTGAGHAALEEVEREIERSVRPDVAVRQSSFWLLAVAFGLTMAGLAGVLLYQIPLLIDRGMPAGQASWVLGATAAMGVVGKLGFGALLDRYDQRWVAAVCFVLQAAGVLLLWQTHSVPALVCYVILYGYSMGGNATLQASLVAQAFGRVHYGAISGRMTPFVVMAQAIGVPATGWLRDVTGGFEASLAAIVVASLVAAVVVLQVRLPAKA